jgi:phospholipase/carboxylesterase
LIGLGINRRWYAGTCAGTPVVMGCSDADPHIPKARFLETAEVFRALNAGVDAVLYPNFGHTVNEDEINRINGVLQSFASNPQTVDADT